MIQEDLLQGDMPVLSLCARQFFCGYPRQCLYQDSITLIQSDVINIIVVCMQLVQPHQATTVQKTTT